MNSTVLDKTRFLNVDLRIYSKAVLHPLVSAMGKKVIVLYEGRERRMHKAQLELARGNPKSPEAAIRRYCQLIGALPEEIKELWNTAQSREFDVGIEAPEPMHYYWFSVAPKVIEAAAKINAKITVTIYGPMKLSKARHKSGPGK